MSALKNPDAAAEQVIQWKAQVSLFKNNPATRQILQVLGLPFGALLLWMGKIGFVDGVSDGRYAFYFIGLFLLIAVLVVLAVFGGSYDVEYRLDGQGISSANQEKQRKRLSILFGLGVILSIFARRPGLGGTSILARRSLKSFIAWQALQSAKFVPRDRLIVAKAGWTDKIYLFCTEENYETVRARVESALAHGQAQKNERRK